MFLAAVPRPAREILERHVAKVEKRAKRKRTDAEIAEETARAIEALEAEFNAEGVAWQARYRALLAQLQAWAEAQERALRLAEASERMHALELLAAEIAAAREAFRMRNDNAIRALLMLM
jgi:formate dehydrogenase maturation protein FdhE